MKRVAVVGVSSLILSGCALPIPFQVASWVLDGISVVATEKSVADHGLSIVTQSDCAVWRGVVEGDLCRDWDQGVTLAKNAEQQAVMPEPSLSLRQSLAAAAGSENPSHANKTVNADALSLMPSVAVEQVETENFYTDELANFESAVGGAKIVGRNEFSPLSAHDIMPELASVVSASGIENTSRNSKAINADALSSVALDAVVVAVEEVEIGSFDTGELEIFETAVVDVSVAGSNDFSPLSAHDIIPGLASAVSTAGTGNTSWDSKTINADALSSVASDAVVVAVEEVGIGSFDTGELEIFEAAVVDASVTRNNNFSSLPAPDLTPELVPLASTFSPVAELTIDVVIAEQVRVAEKPARNIANFQSENTPEAGIYFVIGSFRSHDSAKFLAGRHEGFVPEVLAAKLGGAPVYRVVVGPIAKGGEKTAHRRLARAGFIDTWVIRVVPKDWQLASVVIGSQSR